MPAFQSPSATIDCGPIRLQASAQDIPFAGSSFTWMRPPVATSEAALTFSEGATFSFNAWSALIAATRIPGLMLAAVVLPPDIGLGPEAVSPIVMKTRKGDRSPELALILQLIKEMYRKDGIIFGT